MRTAVVAALGTAAVFGAAASLVLGSGTASGGPLVLALAVLVGFVGLIGALAKVAGSSGDDESVASAPWDESGALVEGAPERSAAHRDLSGERLAGVVEAAGATARDEGTVAAGVEVVRPDLREALLDVLVQSGVDRSAAEQSLATGTWTEDTTAAAVLDEAVDHPGWSFLERFEAWLFPEQVVRREVRRTMQAVAEVADERLPTVPGQHAPRTVPVLEPTLDDLRRGADGHLQRAVDPLGARTGSDVDGAVRADDATPVETGDGQESRKTDASAEESVDERGERSDGATSPAGIRSPTATLEDVPIGGDGDRRPDGEVSADE